MNLLPEDGRVASFVTAYQSKKTERTGVGCHVVETPLNRVVTCSDVPNSLGTAMDCHGLAELISKQWIFKVQGQCHVSTRVTLCIYGWQEPVQTLG